MFLVGEQQSPTLESVNISLVTIDGQIFIRQ
jgi:hypothetical protein